MKLDELGKMNIIRMTLLHIMHDSGNMDCSCLGCMTLFAKEYFYKTRLFEIRYSKIYKVEWTYVY